MWSIVYVHVICLIQQEDLINLGRKQMCVFVVFLNQTSPLHPPPCRGCSVAPSFLSAISPAPASAESAGPPRSAPQASPGQSQTCTEQTTANQMSRNMTNLLVN